MATSTVENYAKHIYVLAERGGLKVVPMGKVAEAVGVVPGTATTMAKALARAGLARYEPRGGLQLTAAGRALALKVLRRHRLIEFFLVETLRMDWSEIHEEAEQLEHVISDRLLDRLDAFLGHPRFDPHGDPIPGRDGKMAERTLKTLDQCAAGKHVRVARVSDQDGAFLHFIRRSGLAPGSMIQILQAAPEADCLELRLPDRRTLTLGNNAAAKVWVECVEEEE